MSTSKRDIDAVTGVETTGHEWDGVKELNKPLPRWWLLTFYATIVWAIGYWIVYPAWPTLAGYTKGMLGYSQRDRGRDEVKPLRRPRKAAFATSSPPRRSTRSSATRICCALPSAAARPRSRPTARRATAGARRASTAIPTSTTTIGCGAARSRRSTRPSATASARTARMTRASQMPRFGLDKLLDGRADRRRGRVRAVAVGQVERRRPRSRGARRSLPTSAPPVTAATARASRSRARRT